MWITNTPSSTNMLQYVHQGTDCSTTYVILNQSDGENVVIYVSGLIHGAVGGSCGHVHET
jgi:hypothetical protein